MPVCQEGHQSIAVTVPVILGRFYQPLNLVRSQVFASPQFRIRRSARHDCSILVVGETSRSFAFATKPPLEPNCCPNNAYFMNS
jgi:hypothetical protein